MRDDVSSLMDGEVPLDRADDLIERIGRDEGARDTWATYHLIGEVLRGDEAHSSSIQKRIFDKLANEPTVLAPKRRTVSTGQTVRIGAAVAASVATLSVVVWMAGQEANVPSPVARTASPIISASAPIGPVSSSIQSPGIQPVNLNEYLLAHEEFLASTTGYRRASMNTVVPSAGAGNP